MNTHSLAISCTYFGYYYLWSAIIYINISYILSYLYVRYICEYIYVLSTCYTFCYTFICTNIFCLAPFDSYYLSVKGKCWYPILWQYFHQFRFITQARIEVQNQDSCLQFPGVKNQEQTEWTKTQIKTTNKPKPIPNQKTLTLQIYPNLSIEHSIYLGTFFPHSLFQEQDSILGFSYIFQEYSLGTIIYTYRFF